MKKMENECIVSILENTENYNLVITAKDFAGNEAVYQKNLGSVVAYEANLTKAYFVNPDAGELYLDEGEADDKGDRDQVFHTFGKGQKLE